MNKIFKFVRALFAKPGLPPPTKEALRLRDKVEPFTLKGRYFL